MLLVSLKSFFSEFVFLSIGSCPVPTKLQPGGQVLIYLGIRRDLEVKRC